MPIGDRFRDRRRNLRTIRDGDVFTIDEDRERLIERVIPEPNADYPDKWRGEPWGPWAGHDDLSPETARFRRGDYPPGYRDGDDDEPR